VFVAATNTRADFRQAPGVGGWSREGERRYLQAYDVLPGKLTTLEEWFRNEGAPEFLAQQGLVSIERCRPAPDRSNDSPRL